MRNLDYSRLCNNFIRFAKQAGKTEEFEKYWGRRRMEKWKKFFNGEKKVVFWAMVNKEY